MKKSGKKAVVKRRNADYSAQNELAKISKCCSADVENNVENFLESGKKLIKFELISRKISDLMWKSVWNLWKSRSA